MGTITTSYFTFTPPIPNLVPQPKHFFSHNLSNNTLCPNLPFSHSTTSKLKFSVKFKTFSIPTTTHLKVSQDAFTPTEESSLSSNPPPVPIGDNDLLIVGAGVLGRLVAHKWRQEIPGCQVYAQTMTTDHHNELIQMGINPSLKWIEATHKFPNVIFCAPPSRTPNYADNIRQAALSWNGEGSILFTSSTAPYDCSDNGPCDEDTPVVPAGRSPRIDVLLKAENVVLEFGGCVLRLAGLYKADRGAHNYYLEKGIVDSRPDHILNLINYEDAASLSVAILKKKFRGQIFLGCDNHPLSRQEMMDLVNKSGKFSKKFDKFTGTNDHLGKRLNNSRTRREVGWEPKYPSFAHFLESI